MNKRQQERAWNQEVATLEGLIALELRSLAVSKPEEEIRRDAKQAALGVLMLATLPDYAWPVALKHHRMDVERRGDQ